MGGMRREILSGSPPLDPQLETFFFDTNGGTDPDSFSGNITQVEALNTVGGENFYRVRFRKSKPWTNGARNYAESYQVRQLEGDNFCCDRETDLLADPGGVAPEDGLQIDLVVKIRDVGTTVNNTATGRRVQGWAMFDMGGRGRS